MSTDVQGPFYLEWNGTIIVVRCKQPFTGVVSFKVHAEQQAAIFALPPMAMQKDMKLLLSTVGHSDVLVLSKGEA